MSESPAPLVPPDVDLRGYEFMPYYGDRLRESELNSRATDAEYRAAHNLWWSSWKQIPAASLPDNDTDLCKLADLGRDVKTWLKVKARALHGFTLCADGRYYHRVLAPLAVMAWAARIAASAKGKYGASKRWERHGHEIPVAQASGSNGSGIATATKNDSKREERKGKRGLSESPTRGKKGQNPLKNIPEDDPAAVERSRRIGQAMADGNPDLAQRIREGVA